MRKERDVRMEILLFGTARCRVLELAGECDKALVCCQSKALKKPRRRVERGDREKLCRRGRGGLSLASRV